MNAHTDHIQISRRPGRRTRAFTLVEMLVAVAVVAILTIGIGQIFASVSKLVGTGAAVAEVDQAARTVEAQLREDFESLNAMRADETFIAIRNTRLGDFERDASFNANDDVDLYLTKGDEQFDLRNNVLPYEVATDGRKLSRAVTVRLDEIMFIGQSGKGYQSYQGGDATGLTNYALISYAHGLRPPLQTEDDSAPYAPRRLNYADGYFGAHPGDDNPFAPNGQSATGRNRYASDFVLSRQALLLYGPTAFGYQRSFGPSGNAIFFPAPLGYDTEIAMFPRDLEASQFLFGGPQQPDDLNRWPLGGVPPTKGNVMGGYPYWSISKFTVVRHGRTDVCAMGRDDVQRWFEGGIGGTLLSDGSPFSSGIPYEFQKNNPAASINIPLWYRAFLPPPTGVTNSLSVRDSYLGNLRGLQSAIAGTFCRKLVETDPPDLRFDPDDYATPVPDPRDRRMDVHTILDEHCSSFEVAWSDGSRWDGGSSGTALLQVDTNADGKLDRDLRPGDIIWFDMDFTVRDFWDALQGNAQSKEARYPRPNPDPEMGLDGDHVFDELPPQNWGNPNSPVSIAKRTTGQNDSGALNIVEDQDFRRGAYSRVYTQGRDKAHADQEYMAIWGFNPPIGYDRDLSSATGTPIGQPGSSAGNYVRDVPWAKPRLIRVRMTLHDSQNRLLGGKSYEFIFKVDLK